MHLLAADSREFFAPLHGLRGIAILYVIVSHLGNTGLSLFPVPHDAIGKVGVWIFFVLSAFLLTTHLSQDFDITSSKTSSVLQYFVHRIFRIYPLFLFVLIGHVFLGNISSVEFVKHLLLMQGYNELWAIPIEFKYYLIIPIIVIGVHYLARDRIILILMAILALVLLCGIGLPSEVFSNNLDIFPKLAPFLLGSVLALLIDKQKILNKKFPLFIQVILLAVMIIATILYRGLTKGYVSIVFAPWLSIILGASTTGLIYAALQLTVIARLLAARPLVFIGEISFSIYLLHTFIISFMQGIPYLPNIIQAWLSLGLSILCAYISYLAIESPGILFGKRIGRKLQILKPRLLIPPRVTALLWFAFKKK